MNSEKPKHSNALIHESSPYLLQHAHNPVNWEAWTDDVLARAKKENKLILLSIGYSACHWCHVMEHESFEDEKIAQIMNDHFICIKIDREERPDIDQVYMLAVQLMTGHGGWPLNCFTLPDGRPVYGGTYFPKQQWINVLLNLTDLYKHEPEKMIEYAGKLMEGIKMSELVGGTEVAEFSKETLTSSYNNWKIRFDNVEGGPDKAPKFPLPNNYQFLLRYSYSDQISKQESEFLSKHIHLTLKKMAFGGIYDQIGGGFSRYSVDGLWKVPHFEKMLYDNAQLVTLYSEAYKVSKDPIYKQVVDETLTFIEREMTSPEGGFYSALDADSEGQEGKFYVWSKEELEKLIGKDLALFADYFNINERGFWEHGNYILLRHEDDDVIAKKYNITVDELQKKINEFKKIILAERGKRVRPGLDNKILTSWNALMLKGYSDAYSAFPDKKYLEAAKRNAEFLMKNCFKGGGLVHTALTSPPAPILQGEGGRSINGFLEDYCFTIEAFISLYEVCFEEKYLLKANELLEYTILHFQDTGSKMFYFTSDTDAALISRKMEISDNVIPASNSSMAHCLYRLGHHLEREDYIEMSKRMLSQVLVEIPQYGAGYSNWAMLLLYLTEPFFEVAIVGKSVDEKRKELQKLPVSNVIFAGSATESVLPLLKNRSVPDKTFIYVCRNKTCQSPLTTVEEALKQLRS